MPARIEPLLRDAGLWTDTYESGGQPWLLRVIDLLKPRARRLGQFVDDGRLFFAEEVEYDPAAVKKHLEPAGMRDHLVALASAFERLPGFDQAATESSSAGPGRGPRRQAGDADSRDARCRHGPVGEPGPLRGTRAFGAPAFSSTAGRGRRTVRSLTGICASQIYAAVLMSVGCDSAHEHPAE